MRWHWLGGRINGCEWHSISWTAGGEAIPPGPNAPVAVLKRPVVAPGRVIINCRICYIRKCNYRRSSVMNSLISSHGRGE
eukprot:5789991-Pyramimonas_sp.AAC.2